MGNCMGFRSLPKKETRGPLIEVGEVELDASVLVQKMNSASSYKCYMPLCRRPQIGEVYHLAPYLAQSVEPLLPWTTTDNRKVKMRKVKIAMTKEQLQLLLTGAKDFQTKRIIACFRESFRLQRSLKWFPLPTIPEKQNY